MKSSLAGLMVLLAIASWAGYGGLIYQLGRERVAYTDALARVDEESFRDERAARLRTSVQSTVNERAALEELVAITPLRAIETIEQAGVVAGIQDASVGAATQTDAPGDMSAYTFVMSGSGSFSSVMHAVMLLEVLPIPAALEDFHLEKDEQDGVWRLTARVRVLFASEQSV